MNYKSLHGIIYSRLKNFKNESFFVYKPVPAPIEKIKNKYRWRMIIKCKLNSNVLDIIKNSMEDEKLKNIKNTSIIVDINPNSMS